jgi:hypothetical protein
MHLHFIVSRPLLGLLTKLAIDTTSQSICNVRCRWLQDLGWQSLTLDAEPGRTKSPAHVLRALRGEIYLGKHGISRTCCEDDANTPGGNVLWFCSWKDMGTQEVQIK